MVLVAEDGMNNSEWQSFPDFREFVEERKSKKPVYFVKCKADSEL
jgi:hypothetical protein